MAPRWSLRAVSCSAKNSASRSGVASSVDTTTNVVRRSDRSLPTAWERSTNPSYIVWKRMKNSEMSDMNSVPRIRSLIW